jgi:hypothetical protein
VNFFFLTPFLHYHAEDENHFQPSRIDIHSHIISSHHEDHVHHEGHNLDSCDDHEELYQLNTYQFVKLTRSVELKFPPQVLTIINITSESGNNLIKLQKQFDIPDKNLKEKYVQFAANSSPPTS